MNFNVGNSTLLLYTSTQYTLYTPTNHTITDHSSIIFSPFHNVHSHA
ncbi:MAG: hypothetical protein KGV44_04970 [Flavobacteriaceae bacterium]|nr:hypothetical protein [Flavobacteriaceae bacterium]